MNADDFCEWINGRRSPLSEPIEHTNGESNHGSALESVLIHCGDSVNMPFIQPTALSEQKTLDALLKRQMYFVGTRRLCFEKLISTIRQSAVILIFLLVC
jgi:hypothetical protein